MKFIIDEMPKNENECPFSKWKPYPPIVEKTGDYFCDKDHAICNLCESGCRWLKQEGR